LTLQVIVVAYFVVRKCDVSRLQSTLQRSWVRSV